MRALLQVVEDMIQKLRDVLAALGGLKGTVDRARQLWDSAEQVGDVCLQSIRERGGRGESERGNGWRLMTSLV